MFNKSKVPKWSQFSYSRLRGDNPNNEKQKETVVHHQSPNKSKGWLSKLNSFSYSSKDLKGPRNSSDNGERISLLEVDSLQDESEPPCTLRFWQLSYIKLMLETYKDEPATQQYMFDKISTALQEGDSVKLTDYITLEDGLTSKGKTVHVAHAARKELVFIAAVAAGYPTLTASMIILAAREEKLWRERKKDPFFGKMAEIQREVDQWRRNGAPNETSQGANNAPKHPKGLRADEIDYIERMLDEQKSNQEVQQGLFNKISIELQKDGIQLSDYVTLTSEAKVNLTAQAKKVKRNHNARGAIRGLATIVGGTASLGLSEMILLDQQRLLEIHRDHRPFYKRMKTIRSEFVQELLQKEAVECSASRFPKGVRTRHIEGIQYWLNKAEPSKRQRLFDRISEELEHDGIKLTEYIKLENISTGAELTEDSKKIIKAKNTRDIARGAAFAVTVASTLGASAILFSDKCMNDRRYRSGDPFLVRLAEIVKEVKEETLSEQSLQ